MAVPKIRIKGFDKDWRKPTIEEVFELRNGYTPSKFVSEFWTNGTIPWFRMEDIRDKGGILKEAYQQITPIAVKSTGLFNAYSIIMATTATIGIHAMPIVDSLANQQFTNFSIRKSLEKQYDPYFIYYSFFQLDDWAKKNVNSGGLLSVDIKGLLKQPLYSPDVKVQKQIADYFQSLDSLIEATDKKIATLKQVKQASLQSMFPQEGETKPRVRFKGFEGEWEMVEIGKYGDTYSGLSGKSKEDFGKGNAKYITFLNVLTNAQINTSILESVDVRTGERQNTVNKGDILFNTSSETPEEVGLCSVLLEDMPNVYLNSFCFGFRPNNPAINSEFMVYLMRGHIGRSIMKVLAQGATRYNLSKKRLCETLIPIPTNINEQKQIAEYFSNLDKQISIQEQRLEKLKQIKSACLKNMFV